jgi:hypothetical protein
MGTTPSNPDIPRPNRPMSPGENMSAVNMPDRGGSQAEPKPERQLPDPAICRAKPAGWGDYADCLVDGPYLCRFALPFGFRYLCLHPERAAIIARTKD